MSATDPRAHPPWSDSVTHSAGKVSKEEFDAIADRVRVWGGGRPGIPLFTRITPEVTVSALHGVRTGRTVSLGRRWPVHAAVDNLRPAAHYMSKVGEILADGDIEPTGYMDYIGADYHGKAVSHIDAFCHIAYNDRIFGGYPARELVSGAGFPEGDVTLYGPLVTRGVLVDMARAEGREWSEPPTAWELGQIQAALDDQGVTLRSGDAVLFRSGHERRRAALGPWDADASAAGVHVEAVEWLIDQGVALIGADGETDVRPSPVEGVTLPIHVLTLNMAGIPLMDNLKLDDLGDVAAQEGRWEFALVVTPLSITGGTGSPVSPVAVF
jgi:kynurenine formamidase